MEDRDRVTKRRLNTVLTRMRICPLSRNATHSLEGL